MGPKIIRTARTLLLVTALALGAADASAEGGPAGPHRSPTPHALARPRRPPPGPTRHHRTRARRHTAAPAPAVSHLAVIEIEQRRGKGGVERRVLRLPLLGRRGSQLELHDGQLDDELGLHIDSSDKQHASLSLSLDRQRFADKGRSTRVRLGVSRRLSLGRRTLMTGVDLSGGGRLEVYATVR